MRYRIQPVLHFVAAFVAMPFLITGLYRMMPGLTFDGFLGWAPAYLTLASGLAIAIIKPEWKWIAGGFVLGTLAHVAFLIYLFSTWGSIG